jgi:hypothetical protein
MDSLPAARQSAWPICNPQNISQNIRQINDVASILHDNDWNVPAQKHRQTPRPRRYGAFHSLLTISAPEPLARLYSRSFYRATWFTTALDAGFFTALPIRAKWVRDIASILFSVYYLVFAEAADEKVRKVRATVTVEQLRVSWEKPLRNSYVKFVTSLNAGRVRMLREVSIPREGKEPIGAWLYWNGTEDQLGQCDKLVLSFTGGGGVSMTPRCHDEYLIPWTKRLKIPILSVQYKFVLMFY